MSSPEHQPLEYRLNQVYFYLTEGCNLNCRHCWIVPQSKALGHSTAFLPLELFQSVLQQARPLGLSLAKLTGGEPLLHPHLRRFLEIIQAEDLSLGLETNAVLCTAELAAAIAACKRSFVSVSLDGARAETHEWVRGVPGCFQKTLRGIEHLVRAGVRPQVIFTLMQRNREQMTEVVRLARDLGASSVKFNVLQPTARGQELHDRGESLTIRDLVRLGRWAETELSVQAGLPVYFDHPVAFRPLHRMFGEEGNGCGTCGIRGIMGVLADGSYALCGIGQSVPELVFGHAAQDDLEEVWRGNPILQKLRQGLPDRLTGICRDCLMKGRCLGSCIAQNYYRTGSLWAPYWFCEAAAAAGLFPEARRYPGNLAPLMPPGSTDQACSPPPPAGR